MKSIVHTYFLVASTLIAALVLGWGFFLVGSPATRRLEKMDEQRVRDLQTIVSEIHFMVNGVDKEAVNPRRPLPKTLEEASKRTTYQQIAWTDPETNQPYEYRTLDDDNYELCANFATEKQSSYSVFWNHGAGRRCFKINVRESPRY